MNVFEQICGFWEKVPACSGCLWREQISYKTWCEGRQHGDCWRCMFLCSVITLLLYWNVQLKTCSVVSSNISPNDNMFSFACFRWKWYGTMLQIIPVFQVLGKDLQKPPSGLNGSELVVSCVISLLTDRNRKVSALAICFSSPYKILTQLMKFSKHLLKEWNRLWCVYRKF